MYAACTIFQHFIFIKNKKITQICSKMTLVAAKTNLCSLIDTSLFFCSFMEKKYAYS